MKMIKQNSRNPDKLFLIEVYELAQKNINNLL